MASVEGTGTNSANKEPEKRVTVLKNTAGRISNFNTPQEAKKKNFDLKGT